MSKSPAFQFYAQDFLIGVRFFTAEETGAYILLLIEQWDKGYIEKDEKILKKITGISIKKLENVLKKFQEVEGKLINERLEKERNKKIEFIEKQRINGKKGGRPENPTESQNKPKPLETQNPNESSSTSSSISSSNNIHKENLVDSSIPEQTFLFSEEVKKLSSEVANYFSISEMKNLDSYKKIFAFLNQIEKLGQLEHFSRQFKSYQKFKLESKSAVHSLFSFIGYDKYNTVFDVMKGAWNECDWTEKLSKTQGNQTTIVKTNSNRPLTDDDFK